jgi:hypothetical protein
MTEQGQQFFVCRLFAPRTTFMRDMTDAERALMQAHAAYWMGWMAKGKVVVFGPVADPSEPWGLGVVRVENEAEVRALEQNDPVILAGAGFRYEISPMVRALLPAANAGSAASPQTPSPGRLYRQHRSHCDH